MESVYRLSFKKQCTKKCNFCADYGAKSEQNLSLLDSGRIKNKTKDYTKLLVSCNFDFSNQESELIDSLKHENQAVLYQVHLQNFIVMDKESIRNKSIEI